MTDNVVVRRMATSASKRERRLLGEGGNSGWAEVFYKD